MTDFSKTTVLLLVTTLVLISVVAGFSTYIFWLYSRLRQQLGDAVEGLENKAPPGAMAVQR